MTKICSPGKLQKPQIFMACFLACLCSCTSAVHFFFPGDWTFSTTRADFPAFNHLLQAAGPLWVSSCRFASGLTWTQVGSSDHICTWSTLLLLHGSFLTPNSLLCGRDSSFHSRDPLIYEGNELASWHRAVIRYHFRTLR